MINKEKILIVVPARGGSKGVPKKNSKIFGDKPLILHTTDVARSIFNDVQICVSTDDHSIIQIVEQTGLKVPFLRPKNLATDTASTFDVLIHALNYYSKNLFTPEAILLLQPTSPFRNREHILDAIDSYSKDCDMLVSVTESKANPYYNLFEEDRNGWLIKSKNGNIDRRQDCPTVWEYNGAIYIINSQAIKNSSSLNFSKIKKFVMSDRASIDIDSPLDWQIAEFLLSKNKN